MIDRANHPSLSWQNAVHPGKEYVHGSTKWQGRGNLGSDLVLCIGEAVLLSVPWLEPREGFLIDGEIFSFSNGHDFNQYLLVQDPVHDADRFLGG
jgi:hypothetical protein